uniref:TMV resistance protein N n=2 Tax=Cajanus cajan TaxID=3821 RepID=A0A151SPR2_CAJCA|nr:TMV resistance protein N [Cajanus cajan]
MVCPKKYDVFLSFRGEDTRMNFTSHLHEALKQKKVETFIDYELKKGDEISPALINAIEDSHVSIVILSENYASSKWCLEELSKILECRKKQGQMVIPVFYNIDPAHVRKQTGSYEQAFAKHKGQSNYNKWKVALNEIANLAGWDSRNRTESELIKDVVGDVFRKLTPKYPNQLKGVIGIEENYKQIESLLKIGSSEVITLGIWGMGGIGKTTLATTFYSKLSHEFDSGCFLINVRENSNRHGLEALRNKLFSDLLENENHCFDAPFLVPQFVMRRLGCKKVFIVLDDVATSEQLEYLLKDYDDLLGQGSRVIVTTRDKQIFRPHDEVYEVKKLSFNHSLQLFSMSVFEEEQPKHGYEDLSRCAISYCKGIPLALKVLGASFRRKSKEAWESELRKLQKIPNMQIFDILKLSYDGLDDFQQDIFLDIACFFNGERREWVTSLLEACEFFAISGIEVLLNKALITISEFNRIEMHDLIQDMGREIVRQQSIKNPGKRSRIWKHEDVHEVLKYKKGTDVIEGITLDLSKLTGDLNLSSNSFTEMTNLRLLIVHSSHRGNKFNVYLTSDLEPLSYKLRYLRWDGFNLESLPSNFCAEQLMELSMPKSKLKKLWDGVQNLVNLKKINLFGSRDLIEIPDLSMAKNLESVSLRNCESLDQLHPSMSSLPKLTYLDLHVCREIKSLNVHSKSLRELYLDGCSSLKEFSVASEEMTHLGLSHTAISALPSSIWFNKKLTYLTLRGCNNLDKVPPNNFGCTQHNASNLSHLQALLCNIGYFSSLEALYLNGTNVERLPANIKSLSLLTRLYLDNCRKLVSLRELPPSLRELDIDDCRKLVSLPELPPLVRVVRGFNCTSLETNFTQRLVLQHMLHRRIPFLHKQYLNNPNFYEFGYFIFPGERVMDECGFRTIGSSIIIPCLPLSDLCGFIYCIVFSKGSYEGEVLCSIYQDGKKVGQDNNFIFWEATISDHVLFSYAKITDFFYNVPFKIEFGYDDENHQKIIKECGVFPVYASESGLKVFGSSGMENFESKSNTQISYNELLPRAIGIGVEGSNNENEQEEEQLLHAEKRRRSSP